MSPSITLLLSVPDLIYHTSHFLSVDELLCCSALSQRLHAVFESDKVWRRRLGEAKHIQSSWVPLEIQKPYVHRDDEEDEKAQAEDEKHSTRREEEHVAAAQAMLLEQAKRGAFEPSASQPPPLSLALALSRFYYIYRVNANNHLSCDILPLAILPVPPSAQLNSCLPPPAPGVYVYHCRFLLTRDRLVNKSDAREMRLAWDESSSQWQVAAMLRTDSGILALNVHNVRDGRIILPDEPLPSTPSCKQRYIRLLSCSCHSTTTCHHLLPPTPALPPPRPVPAWYSHHLAQFSIRQQPFPPIPESAYPSFHPLPVCYACRLEVKEAVRVFSETWRDREGMLSFEVDCAIRVNEREWDVRWRAYADDVTYRRCVVVAEEEEEEDEADEDEEEEDEEDEEEEEEEEDEEEWRIHEDNDGQLAEDVRQMQVADSDADEADADDEEEKGDGREGQAATHAEPAAQPMQTQQQQQQVAHPPADAAEGEEDDNEEERNRDEWVENAMQPTDATLQWIYGQLADATSQHYQRLMEVEGAQAEGQSAEGAEGEEEEEGKVQRREGAADEEEEDERDVAVANEGATTPRHSARPRANSLPMSDATASSVAASTAATLASSSVSSPSSAASASARRVLFRVERVLMDNDSGVYAINAPTNLPWTELAPRSSHDSHPPVLFMHEHALYHHPRSVYRSGDYVCDVCHEMHDSAHGGVWHCDHCSYDVCEARVAEARREQQAAMEQIEHANQQSTGRSSAVGGLSME